MLPLLLIPEKADPETDAVCNVWKKNGGAVKRLGKYWIRNDEIASKKITLYGNQTFSLVLAQIYNVGVISPDDTLVARLDRKWTCRNISLKALNEISSTDFPVFVKPVIPKLFAAGVFHDPDAFEKAVHGLKGQEQVLVADIIHISAEARAFVLNGKIMDMALYEGKANIEDGERFMEEFIGEHRQLLPSTLVIDLAYAPKKGWFILEFNATWGAGLNGCDPEKVLESILAATINQ